VKPPVQRFARVVAVFRAAPGVVAVRDVNNGKTERPYYYILPGKWYTGSFPQVYDCVQVPAAKILKENYAVIRREVLDYFQAQGEEIEPTFTPYANLKEAGWRTLNLYAMFMRYNENCAKMPETTKIVESIPGMCSAQIAVLHPTTRVRPHFADTSVLMRTHLGLQIPGTLPDIGMRVKKNEICWKDGETFSFCPAHRHYTWNRTNGVRIMLQVDTYRPEFHRFRHLIGGHIMAAMATKYFTSQYPILRKVPRVGVLAAHRSIGIPMGIFLWLQHRTGFDTAGLLAKLKRK